MKKSFQKILNTLRCDIIMWHGDVIFYNKITSQIHVRLACGCSFVFLLAWLVLGRLGVFGEQGKQGISSGEQGNKGQILRGTGEQRQYWGTGNIRKQIFDFWGTGEQANLFQGDKGAGTPLGGPHQYSNTLIRERYHRLGSAFS